MCVYACTYIILYIYIYIYISHTKLVNETESERHSVVSDSLRPYELYSPWDSPGQNTAVSSLSLLRGSSQPRD